MTKGRHPEEPVVAADSTALRWKAARARARASIMAGMLAPTVILVVALALAMAGCSSSKDTYSPRYPAVADSAGTREPEPENVPPSRTTFGYLVQNEGCRCEEYSTSDRKHPVGYRFRATYKMDAGFITSISIRFENRGADTLFLDPGAVMVSSRNVDYQYNNKFIPLPDMVITPGNSENLDLDGKEVTTAPSWKKIAGEQLTLTIRGMRYGEKVLGQQTVTFIPENPLLQDRD